jgi:hypothetical protein
LIVMGDGIPHPWRQAFRLAALWVGGAAVITCSYQFEWLGRPLPYELWAVVGLLLFAGNATLPLTAGFAHRSFRVGIAVALLESTVLLVTWLILLIRFAGAAGGLH